MSVQAGNERVCGAVCRCGHADFFHDGSCEECPCSAYDFDPEWACTHCGGEGRCDDGADPEGSCPDDSHPCHACHGSGARKDQWLF